jgi:hypothetical protein
MLFVLFALFVLVGTLLLFDWLLTVDGYWPMAVGCWRRFIVLLMMQVDNVADSAG